MKNVDARIGWTAIGTALVLWGLFCACMWLVSNAETERRSLAAARAEKVAQRETTLKLQSIIRDTREERAALETMTTANFDRILDEIEIIGAATGLDLEIGQSVSQGGGVTSLKSTSILVSGNGTFQKALHLVSLLETFPIPSVIDEVQIERGEKASWRVAVRLRVLTANDPTT